MIKNIPNVSHVDEGLTHCHHNVRLKFADMVVTVHSNEPMLLAALADYYRSYGRAHNADHSESTPVALEVYAIEQEDVGNELAWQEVPREAGKQGCKEGYLDVEGGRWIKKFKTSMSFLQRPNHPVAVGPCVSNLAQVVNFINNQFLNHYLRQGFTLGHASAFCVNGKATAIAAGSGGGKSTLMLRCLEHPQRRFLTNDRILFKQTSYGAHAVGVAKLPRVNPGTLLNSNRLRHILPESRQSALRLMTQGELWTLEEKYDVQVEDEYGADRVQLSSQLTRLIMLDWSLDSAEATQLEPVDLAQNAQVIEGLRKRPGPFYQDRQGAFADLEAIDSVAHYCDALASVDVYRLTGKIDFDRAYELINALEPA